jgi:hypothetical protein
MELAQRHEIQDLGKEGCSAFWIKLQGQLQRCFPNSKILILNVFFYKQIGTCTWGFLFYTNCDGTKIIFMLALESIKISPENVTDPL